MDLRPANIMWRAKGENDVEIQLIDFEDALLFGQIVPNREIYEYNRSYPLFGIDQALRDAGYTAGKKDVHVVAFYNAWFLESVSAWAQQDEFIGFGDFMFEFCDTLLKNRKLEDLIARHT